MANADAQTMMKALQEPFAPTDIEWRVQQAGATKDGKYWAMVLAYVTNRAIQERLDDVCGIDRWRNEFTSAPDGGIMCGLSIKFGEEWITKWDGAENTQVEAVKGGLSGAMKRSAVQWGIGRYLYNLESTFVNLHTDKGAHTYTHYDKDTKTKLYWSPPSLPGWAVPGSTTSVSEVVADVDSEALAELNTEWQSLSASEKFKRKDEFTLRRRKLMGES